MSRVDAFPMLREPPPRPRQWLVVALFALVVAGLSAVMLNEIADARHLALQMMETAQ